jgi:protein-S-isoprenylcysteine O-methyltransferase Ste14
MNSSASGAVSSTKHTEVPLKSPVLPRSYGGWSDPLTASATVLIAYAMCRHWDVSDALLTAIIVVAAASVMSVVEYFRANRGVARPRFDVSRFRRQVLRYWIDALAGLGLVVSFWWLLEGEYGRREYAALWEVAGLFWWPIPIAILVGCALTEWRLGSQRTASTALADWLLSPGAKPDFAAMRQALLGLTVRAIFLPINFCSLVQCIAHFRGREVELFSGAPGPVHAEAMLAIYTLLIAVLVPGYLFSSRLLATHLRAVDATLLGWAVTLACYRPLSVAVFDRWLAYRGAAADRASEKPWAILTGDVPALLLAAGMAIILLELLHLWGEATFGLRASNLSNRGIICCGPYRFTKHPIYLSKCLGWLLIYMPFAIASPVANFRSTILFAVVCALFFARAYAEERLLARDPDYVAYALWIDRNGVFAGLARHLPWLSFRARLEAWQRLDEVSVGIVPAAVQPRAEPQIGSCIK